MSNEKVSGIETLERSGVDPWAKPGLSVTVFGGLFALGVKFKSRPLELDLSVAAQTANLEKLK